MNSNLTMQGRKREIIIHQGDKEKSNQAMDSKCSHATKKGEIKSCLPDDRSSQSGKSNQGLAD